MIVEQLQEQFYLKVDDQSDPPLWSEEEVLGWLNEAEIEACRRARLLVDSQTTAICRITLVTNTEFYSLDRRVIYLRRAVMLDTALPLEPMDYRDLDHYQSGWSLLTGATTGYILGLDTKKFRPYPIPPLASNNKVVALTVVREPLVPMAATTDSPEIDARFHLNLLDWVLYRAYSKRDAETLNEKLAADYLKDFEREFGPREKAPATEEETSRLTYRSDGKDGSY